MIQPIDIHTITEFRRNAQLSDRIAQDGRPHVLTEEGRPKLVVQDAVAYQRILEALDRAEAVQGIRAGLESVKRGEGRPAREVFDELRRKHDIPSDA
ncbi:MAG: type II toxin-antitoxin system Phd/YefM family antitoxin [Planctomycetota bacterium]|nr:type II toxin-antitoxin system Phd/YefM family antitoxin [Planctomycetota bacterium]